MKMAITLGIAVVMMGCICGCSKTVSETMLLDDETGNGRSGDEAMGNPDTPQGTVEDGLVFIKGGTYLMGSPESEDWREDDETEHEVTVSDFYIGQYEVTQKEYREFMGDHESTFSGENLPVENVSWYDAAAYCNARSQKEGLTPAYIIDGQQVTWDQGADGYRLPTEAEWEYACRAGTDSPFNTETSIGAEEANYFGHYPYQIEGNYFSQNNLDTKSGEYRQTTTPVGSFSPNPWNLYDMHGNVGEWVWDYYGEYATAAQTNPTGPESGTFRVNRGGGWNDFAKNLRSAYRSSTPPENRGISIGFRIARGAAVGAGIINTPMAAVNSTDGQTGHNGILIAYFSWGGNTRGIAEAIQGQTGADLFEIECVTPYSSDYNTVLNQAQRNQHDQARPELSSHVENMDEYDFSGKTILPFCSHGGGRFGQSLTAIAKLAPEAVISEGLAVSYSGGSGLQDDISGWLERNGIQKH